MTKKVPQPDGSIPQKPSMLQTVGAMVAGILAVKLATYVVTTLWRLVLREDPADRSERPTRQEGPLGSL